jgi:hypothetical protein
MSTLNTAPGATPSINESSWEARWVSADGPFDPAYERTNAALRRWVDGMEQALLTGASTAGAGRAAARRRTR